MTEFSITPAELLREAGAAFKTGTKWLTLRSCPFCDGGAAGDRLTFVVHAADGNFACSRSKCGARGNFWKLLEFYGRDPREYRSGAPGGKSGQGGRGERKTSKMKKFLYGG